MSVSLSRSRAGVCAVSLLILLGLSGAFASCSSTPADQVCTDESCVELPKSCPCPEESYCDLATNSCRIGCIDDKSCKSGRVCDTAMAMCRDLAGGACPCQKGAYCDLGSNKCVLGCTEDSHCRTGQTCDTARRQCLGQKDELLIDPPTVQITPSADPQQVRLKAISKVDGDVTASAKWKLSDTAIGTIDKGLLMVRGGAPGASMYKVEAQYKDATASADLVFLQDLEIIDPSAPTDAKGAFGGALTGTPPTVVYPLNGAMLPPNLIPMKLQWRRDIAQQIFRIRLSSASYKADLYVGSSLCSADQCTYNFDDATWRKIGKSLAGQAATIGILGVASKGNPVGSSALATVSFSPEEISGGVYYFSTSTKGIKRAPIGAKRAIDFVVNGAETGCAGCHAVSRDGKQVAIEFGSGATRVGSTVVSGNRASLRNFSLTPTIAWNFAWFNPAGDKLIANWNGGLTVRDASNGAVLSTVAASKYGTGYSGGAMPEWSPDGKWIAFVRLRSIPTYDFELSDEGDIVIMPYNGGSFGQAVPLVLSMPKNEVHFWPTWSPDSKWLIFTSQTCDGSTCAQYNAVKTRLRMVRAVNDDGTAATSPTPIELLQGTHEKGKNNNWPKFAPFYQAGRYGFVVYSAKYKLGFDVGTTTQLYMFGVDMDKAKAGTDPSFKPVYLPFQENGTDNHSAIWTTDVRCQDSTDCPNSYQCAMNVCTPIL